MPIVTHWSFTALLLLLDTSRITTRPDADKTLPCAVHRDFNRALEAKQLVLAEGAFEAHFTREGPTFFFSLTRSDGSEVLKRQFNKLACNEVGPAGALVVERYFTDLDFKRPGTLVLPVKVATAPVDAGVPVTPETPDIPVARQPRNDELPSTTAIFPRKKPKVSSAPTWRVPEATEPELDAGPMADAGPGPLESAVVDAGAANESGDAGFDAGADAGLPPVDGGSFSADAGQVTPGPTLSLSSALGVTGWYEPPSALLPGFHFDTFLSVNRWLRFGVSADAQLQRTQIVEIENVNRGALQTWSLAAAAAAGLCSHPQRFSLCTDVLLGARVTRAEATGALYRRTASFVVLPTAGLEGEAAFQLIKQLSVLARVSAMAPLGRSVVQVEGAEQSYTTPTVDLLGSLGLRFTFF